MPDALRHSQLLGHLVRADSLSQQGRSSYSLAFDALDEADFGRAAEYGRITVQEASEAYELYAVWLRRIPQLLVESGVDADVMATARHEIVTATGDPDFEVGWSAYRRAIVEFESSCRDADAEAARSTLSDARRTWQHHHDRACDTICALFDCAAVNLGETFIGTLWDTLLADMYERSATAYHPDKLCWPDAVQRLLLDIFEATRGHLTGPGRDGEFAVVEEPDRWVITFAPCGSGGRTYTPAAPETAVTTAAHDWAWNSTGVCLYCAHCCLLQQREPIARLGFPLRVIDPPRRGQNESVCTWSIYKDRERAPDHAYTDVGFDPPAKR